MLLKVNGERLEMSAACSVEALLDQLGIHGTVAVQRNGALVRRSDQADTVLEDADELEIVQFVGGG